MSGLRGQEFESFDRKEWRQITKDIDYSPDGKGGNAGENNMPRGKGNAGKGRQRGELQDDNTSRPISGSGWGTIFPFAGPVLKIIFIVLAIAVLVLVISKLVGNNIWLKRKKKEGDQEQMALEDIEENLMESDLMRWLRKAVEDKNYRLALRIYYLMIIKELSIKGLIIWKKEKTNLEYLYEMRDHGSHSQFEEITGIYQLVWYGEKELGDGYLINASHKFKDYFQAINTLQNG
ncbi:hypothetical protein C900_00035 [Fulvivirga imtechensis AK7]|uniref:DUF4129 domain-containing protein n=1 Tax=Fulvivirga imtechensis AK7 TaxID=1237149 RepID=L8JXU0_9BACT|nr:PepSY domain-containing protein [Fulvivirga imtechensis]ELR73871.1 hypothetical protein C900_00035 [Fulvivirga imtechensis AK7]